MGGAATAVRGAISGCIPRDSVDTVAVDSIVELDKEAAAAVCCCSCVIVTGQVIEFMLQ